jgi:hypothetical protein
MAPAHGVRFGSTQLFRWSDPNITAASAFFPALLDTGSSCLVIPDSVQVVQPRSRKRALLPLTRRRTARSASARTSCGCP